MELLYQPRAQLSSHCMHRHSDWDTTSKTRDGYWHVKASIHAKCSQSDRHTGRRTAAGRECACLSVEEQKNE